MNYKSYETEMMALIKEHCSGNENMPVNNLLLKLNLSRENAAVSLCTLFINGLVQLIKRRGDKTELLLYANQEEHNKDGCGNDELEQLSACVDIVGYLVRPKSIDAFHEITQQAFAQMPLLVFLKQCQAKFNDLQFLSRYIAAFFRGETPLCIMDMGLHKDDILHLLQTINQERYILLEQGLITITRERAGYYLGGILNERLLQLLRKETINPIAVKGSTCKGMYFEINHERINPCNLFYNERDTTFYHTITDLLKNDSEASDFTILLHGKPGTGKTEFAYQLAKTIGIDVMQLNFSEIQSKWIGETEKNLQMVFDAYHQRKTIAERPVILLLNEADGMMNKRVAVHVSNDSFHNQVQTKFLELLESFSGILIATTNQTQNIDEAFQRRFLYRQEITLPDANTREKLIAATPSVALISAQFKIRLRQASWSPAQLKNVEKKLTQLKRIKEITPAEVEHLFADDLLHNEQSNIGFKRV